MRNLEAIDVLLLLAWAGVTLYYGGLTIIDWLALRKLKGRGVAVTAKVLGKEERQSRGTRNRRVLDYFVTYQYDYSGGQHEHTQQISRKHYEVIKKGQRLEALCLPDDPQTALLTGKDADNSHFKRRLATAIFCAVLLVLVAGVTLLPRR
jgi:hypothetical protein